MSSLGQPAPAGLGRVRWRSFTIVLLLALLIMVILSTLTAQSVLAVSLNISGRPFTVTAAQLQGQDFEEFGILEPSSISVPGQSHRIAVAVTAMRSVTISHLCQAVNIGGVEMIIRAGDGATPVSATNLVVYADRFSGNASFKHLVLSQNSGTFQPVPGLQSPAGAFSMRATRVTISDLVQHAFATTSSTFTLPGFSLQFGGSC